MKLINGVDQLSYTTSPLHAYLDDGATRPEGPNIGQRGEHLTVTFLSFDRLDLSLRLLRSIEEHMPDFAGQVLIFDNRSSAPTIDGLCDFISKSHLNIRLVENGANVGIARGRNRAMKEVTTNWAMSLDNDIVFVGDPRATVQNELSQLGCKFLSLPLLNPDRRTYFAAGGHLHLRLDERDLVAVSGGGSFRGISPTSVSPPSLGTFLFGTASILEVEAFLRCGGFDESLFVGFEDIDFSIRLFRSGLKVGCSGGPFLVHDHPPSNDSQPDYESTRFSRSAIRASAECLERKHGFSFWNADLRNWLDTKMPGDSAATILPTRPKVALIVDVENWAFDNIAKQLQQVLNTSFELEIFAANTLKFGALAGILHGFDLAHFLARGQLAALWAGAREGHSFAGWPVAELMKGVESRTAISVGVYDHLYLGMDEVERYGLDPHWHGIHLERFAEMFRRVDAYYVSSRRLFDIYSRRAAYPPPKCSLPDGVDLSLFRPLGDGRREGPLRVGWAGNSTWMGNRGEVDPKGLRTVLRPAIERLRDEGLPIELMLADRESRFLPHGDMPCFYNSLDVFVCCSESEGTPNPVLEAMACGIPVVSTDVGIVPEAFGTMQGEFIVERSVGAFADALRTLARDYVRRDLLRKENLASIEAWDWRKKAADIGEFFQDTIRDKQQRREERMSAEPGP
jgi:GT2 family glycosyltransferase